MSFQGDTALHLNCANMDVWKQNVKACPQPRGQVHFVLELQVLRVKVYEEQPKIPNRESSIQSYEKMTLPSISFRQEELEFQLTRKDFDGDITLILFPLLKLTKQKS